jgi:hypothetical protein
MSEDNQKSLLGCILRYVIIDVPGHHVLTEQEVRLVLDPMGTEMDLLDQLEQSGYVKPARRLGYRWYPVDQIRQCLYASGFPSQTDGGSTSADAPRRDDQ